MESVIKSLDLILRQGKKSNHEIERNLKSQKKWGARDRRFYAESVYEILRSARSLAFRVGNSRSHLSWSLEDIWQLWGAYILIQGQTLPDWIELQNLSLTEPSTPASRAVQYSISDAFDELGLQEWGDPWEGFLKALNTSAEVYLRTNELLISARDLQKKLQGLGILSEQVSSDRPALRLLERKNLASSEAYKEGLFEIQDLASQEVAIQVDPQAGETVIDACAGAGGKTLHLATLMKNRGRLIALDVSQAKLEILKKRAERNRVGIIETQTSNSFESKSTNLMADRILLDVPCTGSGVLRRNPDAKLWINSEKLHELQKIQQDILGKYAGYVKPGGLLVYSTCSIFPTENQNQIKEFLSLHGDAWKLISERFCDPRERSWDGFFIATLKKKSLKNKF